MNKKTFGKKGTMIAAVAITMLVGATGATVLKASAANAQTTAPAVTTNTTAPAVTDQSQGSSSGSVKSNEDATHEAQESAQWEAAENAGKQPWLNPSAYGGNPHTQSSGSMSK